MAIGVGLGVGLVLLLVVLALLGAFAYRRRQKQQVARMSQELRMQYISNSQAMHMEEAEPYAIHNNTLSRHEGEETMDDIIPTTPNNMRAVLTAPYLDMQPDKVSVPDEGGRTQGRYRSMKSTISNQNSNSDTGMATPAGYGTLDAVLVAKQQALDGEVSMANNTHSAHDVYVSPARNVALDEM